MDAKTSHGAKSADVDDMAGLSRRGFLVRAAAGTAAVAATGGLTGCSVLGRVSSHTLDFTTDFGVLNYAYALEVLESDFYRRVVSAPPRDLRAGELDILRAIGAHEDSHRKFFARAIGPFKIQVPERDFSSIDFTSRAAVLRAAQTFEDTGVSAYNGAGKYLSLPEFLTIAGKIVSVEARHAATVRDLLFGAPRAFAGDDVVDSQGRDLIAHPSAVIDKVQPYFKSRIRVLGA